jgi:hypothetical protein
MSQFIEPKYRKEALRSVPQGYGILPYGAPLKPSDLVWTSHCFRRADSELWLFSPLVFYEDVICAVRLPELSDFEQSVPVKRNYTLK